jgi:hypothetical protein
MIAIKFLLLLFPTFSRRHPATFVRLLAREMLTIVWRKPLHSSLDFIKVGSRKNDPKDFVVERWRRFPGMDVECGTGSGAPSS